MPSESIDFARLFITRERFEAFLETLEQARRELFTNQTTPSDLLAKHFPSEVVAAIMQYFSANGINTSDISDVDSDIKKLLVDLNSYKSLKLATAIDLSEHIVKELFMWVSEKVGPNVILDLRVKPYIIGGAEISYNGKYIDCSIRNKI